MYTETEFALHRHGARLQMVSKRRATADNRKDVPETRRKARSAVGTTRRRGVMQRADRRAARHFDTNGILGREEPESLL